MPNSTHRAANRERDGRLAAGSPGVENQKIAQALNYSSTLCPTGCAPSTKSCTSQPHQAALYALRQGWATLDEHHVSAPDYLLPPSPITNSPYAKTASLHLHCRRCVRCKCRDALPTDCVRSGTIYCSEFTSTMSVKTFSEITPDWLTAILSRRGGLMAGRVQTLNKRVIPILSPRMPPCCSPTLRMRKAPVLIGCFSSRIQRLQRPSSTRRLRRRSPTRRCRSVMTLSTMMRTVMYW